MGDDDRPKNRTSELHRLSVTPPRAPSSDGTRARQTIKPKRQISWAFLTFVFGALFFAWRFTPPGILPDAITYATVTGRLEGNIQSEVTRQSTAAVAAQEAEKARAVAPIEIDKAAKTAATLSPIEVQKSAEIAAVQAEIDLVRQCRAGIQQEAIRAFSQCSQTRMQPGALCDSIQQTVLEGMDTQCGTLPNSPPASAPE